MIPPWRPGRNALDGVDPEDADCSWARGLAPRGWTADDLPHAAGRIWAWGPFLGAISNGAEFI
eukprot:2639362-Pyramimonas_sp.AAC.1